MFFVSYGRIVPQKITMIKIILKIDGMMCGMCESHINDCIRNNFDVKKVTSSHFTKKTVIVCANDIFDEKLTDVISQTGYKVISIQRKYIYK